MARDPTRDVVRGLTSLEMTFVNFSEMRWTSHAGYIGHIRYADTVFPCFAFLAGMSPTPPRRSIGLIGIGIGVNTLNALAKNRPLRCPGVLQRLGLASLIANASLLEPLRQFNGAPLVLLWYAITLLGASGSSLDNPLAHPDYPAADVSATAQTRIDRLFFNQKQLFTDSFDPEGLLGALTTAVSMVIGGWFNQSTLTTAQKAITAGLMVTVGELLHLLVPRYAPISKDLWTPSFVLVTSGVSMAKYLAVEQAVPYLPSALRDLLQAVGKRSLETYVFSSIFSMVLRFGGHKSIASQAMSFIGKFTGPGVADFVVTLGHTGIVALVSKFLVAKNLRLRW